MLWAGSTDAVVASTRIAAIGLWCGWLLNAQILPRLQAHSEPEFDAYLEVEHKRDPSLCAKFAASWPDSELLPRVWEIQFESYKGRGDLPHAIAAGRQALAAYRNNLTVEVELASLLAQSGSLPEAKQRAQHVLDTLATFQRPQQTPRQTWLTLKQNLISEAHAAIGLADYREGNLKAAISEFEAAVRIRQTADATQHLRLGRLYRELGRIPEARQQFRFVLQTTTDPQLGKLAQSDLDALPGR